LLGALAVAIGVHAAELRILSAAAVQIPALEVAQRLERENGHRVTFEFATAGEVDERLARGAQPDIAIAPRERIATRAPLDAVVRPLGTVRIGVAARAGTPWPDLSSVDAFRAALVAARSIAYGDPARGATTGIHFAKVIRELGLAEALAGKTVLAANGLEVMRTVTSGGADLGITQASEILHIDATTYAGPLPDALQLATTYVAWVRDAANAPARALVDAMAEGEGRARFRAAGFD